MPRMRKPVKVAIPEVQVKMKDVLIPMYKPVWEDIFNHGHTHYVFSGGRG